MVNEDPAIPHTGFEWTTPATARQCTATRMRAVLVAAMTVAIIALALSPSARAATITVDSLADTGSPGTCVLRDAITAANTMTATNGCAAGTGNDRIQFSVTGTISIGSTLPEITDRLLTINGPAFPGITIDGGSEVQVMQVASGSTLSLNQLRIINGIGNRGGGIENEGRLTVTNSTFSGNGTRPVGGGGPGGGIYNQGTLTVSDSTFSGNSAVTVGGGIFNGGTGTVSDSTFSGNYACDSGCGIYNQGTLTVSDSTFSGNSATIDGGGIYNQETGTVSNSTFSGNYAFDGGGISNFGKLSITNSTFSGNSTFEGFFGGGIYNDIGTSSIKSVILANSTSGNCYIGRGAIDDAGYNISDDNSCGFTATGSRNNTNPMLDPAGLANNGGPTQTIALLSTSPAIDAIPLADCTDQASPPNPIITDQRLFPRPDSKEDLCDIGAYEFQDTAFIPFSRFHGGLRFGPARRVLYLGGRFQLGPNGSIDPTTQPVSFSVGSYAIRLPAGSFTQDSTGYFYQNTVNGIFLRLYIKFTDTPGRYVLLANRNGGSLTTTTKLVPVTLTIGDNSGSALMKARFD